MKKMAKFLIVGTSTIIRDVFVNWLFASWCIPKTVRFLLYRLYGMQIYTRNISSKCFFGGKNIIIGARTFVNYKCFFDTTCRIEIGSDCTIAMDVLFCTSSHEIGEGVQAAGTTTSAPIKVGNGCWIGARAMILPGVAIGERCVIAAGAVVIDDCEPSGVYAGVPARRIKQLPPMVA